VPGREQRAVGVVEQVHPLDAGRGEVGERGVVVGDRQVELALEQPVVQPRHVVVEHPEVHVRVPLLEPRQHRRQERRERRREGTEPQPPAAPSGQGSDLLLGGVEPGDDRPGVPYQDHARLGELHRPAGPVDDPLPDRPLQCRDVLAHRRLGHPQRLGRGREGPPVGHLGEHLEPAHLSDKHH